jgi:hypothetical protein
MRIGELMRIGEAHRIIEDVKRIAIKTTPRDVVQGDLVLRLCVNKDSIPCAIEIYRGDVLHGHAWYYGTGEPVFIADDDAPALRPCTALAIARLLADFDNALIQILVEEPPRGEMNAETLPLFANDAEIEDSHKGHEEHKGIKWKQSIKPL